MAKPNLMVAIGIGKKKPKMEEGPPPSRFTKPAEPAAEEAVEEVAEPGVGESPLEEAAEAAPGGLDLGATEETGGIGPLDVDYSDNDLCESCANMGQEGSCVKYGFAVDPTGHCAGGYEPLQAEEPVAAPGAEALGTPPTTP